MSDWNDTVIAELRANGGNAPSIGGAPLLILHTDRREERPGATVAVALPRAR